MDEREPDIHNFSTSSEHRLPTISGAEALQNAAISSKGIPTGLPGLDTALLPNNIPLATPGIQIGHVTEIFGPPGVGKTTFGLQLAVNAIRSRRDESRVLWVNTGSPLIEERLEQINDAYVFPLNDNDPPSSPPQDMVIEKALLEDKFDYLEILSLPRLLTLFLHPTDQLPAKGTCLIVIDDFSNFILGSFSNDPAKARPTAPIAVQEKLAKKAAGKRFQIRESLAAAMSKLAALRDLAILVLTGTTTNLKDGEQRGVLTPAFASKAWESAVHTRIMLYRDFPPDGVQLEPDVLAQLEAGLRYADVQKLARKQICTSQVPFVITAGGLQVVDLPDTIDYGGPTMEGNEISERRLSEPDLPPLPLGIEVPEVGRKRNFHEIADSEDDDSDSFSRNSSDADADGDGAENENEQPALHDENHNIHDDHEQPDRLEFAARERRGYSSDDRRRQDDNENPTLFDETTMHDEHREREREREQEREEEERDVPELPTPRIQHRSECRPGDDKHKHKVQHDEHADSQNEGEENGDEQEEEEEEEEEMILDVHETSLLRAYRHAAIRGSEDMQPVYSSDGEVADSEDGEDAMDNG